MLLPVNWLARWLGFAWLGVVTFGISAPPGRGALIAQVTCYALGALGMAGWLAADYLPGLARRRDRVVPVCLGVMAVTMGLAATTGHGGTFLIIYGAIATLAAAGDMGLTTALAVTATGILATEIGGLAGDGGLPTLLGLPVVLAGGFMVGRNRAAYRVQAEQAAALLAQRERLQAEQRRADLLAERARIAREIHDVLAHSLGALGIQIQAARSVLTDRGDIVMADDLLAAAQRMAAEGLVETRRALHALRADTLPLDEELTKVTATYGERYRVTVGMRTEGTPRPVPADATVALLRVAQEALVNAAKHAAGQPVTLSLEFGAADLQLTVRNDLPPGDDARRSAAQGSAAQGSAAQGSAAQGSAAQGSAAQGSAAQGSAAQGSAAQGSAAQGSAAQGSAAEDSAADPGGAATAVRTANAGYGLTGMRERLRMLNGTLEAGRAGGQWAVSARLPLPDSAPPGRALPERAQPPQAPAPVKH